MSYLILFALGAAGGLIGDAGHVQSGTTRYLDHGVPFVWESAIWFVLAVAGGTVALGAIRVRLGPVRPGGMRDGAAGVAAVIGIYAVTAVVRDAALGPSTALVYALAALVIALMADRPALICAGLAVVGGVGGEIVLAQLDVFAYARDIDCLAGVPPWLPGLYLAFGVVAARLGELLLDERPRRA
ncbi:MAG: hypothetical protein QOI80_456 [Solirubrobacteraceae bacterium]|nr:hypothetical protein [Solirubrobacteraceae bacterium]